MGARTDAARQQVLSARSDVEREVARLEASARAAVDIPAKARRNPARTAGLAAGAGFLLLGGPKRLVRGVRRAVFGTPAPLPKSMLPKEIDEALRKVGPDGDKVRGTIEREFAAYLEEKAPERQGRDLGAMSAMLLGLVGKPIVERYGKQLVEQLFSPDGPGFADQLERIRRRDRERAARAQTPADDLDAGQ